MVDFHSVSQCQLTGLLASFLSFGFLLPMADDRSLAKPLRQNTFSIIAYDPQRREWGVATASKVVAGGDRRGKQSAATLVVRDPGGDRAQGDRAVDLRVDDHVGPIQELARILALELPKPK